MTWEDVKDRLAGLASSLTLVQRLVLSGVFVGAAAGVGTAFFDRLIVVASRLSVDRLAALSRAWRALGLLTLPALGALLGGLLTVYVCPEARGHGVEEVLKAIQEFEGLIRRRVAWVKALASALTIGFGGSAGREGPSIQIGGAMGSWVGQLLRVPPKDLKVLVASGAAAGLAAAFGTPLAAVFFAMEVIVRDFASESFPAIVIASVTATASARFLMGSERFLVPLRIDWHGRAEFLCYAATGLVAAPVGVFYYRCTERVEQWFEARRRLPLWLSPALGGVLVGLIALAVPSVTGTGQATINAALRGELPGREAAFAVPAKALATAATLGSGGSGGALMPALFVGAAAGRAWGAFVARFLHLAPTRGGLALTGMAVVITTVYQAPITAIIMALEISQDYDLLMPVMCACALAFLVTRRSRRAPLLEH